MDEIFTTALNNTSNNKAMNESDAIEKNLGSDELMFYHSLRTDLELLKKNPSPQTVHKILDYSRSLR